MRGSRDSKRKLDLILLARKILLIYIQQVLPPLLNIDWRSKCGGEDCFTLVELFAAEIWDSLISVKEATKKGNQVDFFADDVLSALVRAQESLKHAEDVCDTTESQLSCQLRGGEEGFIDTIRKRSLWPMAMYSCKFELSGVLTRRTMRFTTRIFPKTSPFSLKHDEQCEKLDSQFETDSSSFPRSDFTTNFEKISSIFLRTN